MCHRYPVTVQHVYCDYCMPDNIAFLCYCYLLWVFLLSLSAISQAHGLAVLKNGIRCVVIILSAMLLPVAETKLCCLCCVSITELCCCVWLPYPSSSRDRSKSLVTWGKICKLLKLISQYVDSENLWFCSLQVVLWFTANNSGNFECKTDKKMLLLMCLSAVDLLLCCVHIPEFS